MLTRSITPTLARAVGVTLSDSGSGLPWSGDWRNGWLPDAGIAQTVGMLYSKLGHDDAEQGMSTDFQDSLVELLPRLRRFAVTLTGNLDAADDLVQQGCEKALLKQSQWLPGSRLDSWMYRILQNLHIDQLRSQGRRSAHLHEDNVAELVDTQSGARPESENMVSVVSGLIQKLPEEQRVIMLLVAVEEYSYREVAETLDIPIGTVMSRLARARTRIIAMLDTPKSDAAGSQNNG